MSKTARLMKDSGIEWIGEIPVGWSVAKIKQHFDVFSGTTPKSDNPEFWDGDIPWITPADFKTDDIFVESGHRNLTNLGIESANLSLAPAGSLIFSKRAPIGQVVISKNDLCTNQGCLSIIKRDKTVIKYFYYVISIATEIFELLGSGTTFKEISANNFINTILPLPPLSEQTRIAAYLDAKCGKIDSIIAAEETAMVKLKAYKQSLITETVTKGLDPKAPMKDSGIEWIGEIPVGWKAVRVKNILQLKRCAVRVGPFGSQIKGSDFTDSGVAVYNQRTVLDNNFKDCNTFISEGKYKSLESFAVEPLDVLITTRGTIGKIAIAPATVATGIIHPCIIKFSIDRSVISDQFLKYIFNETQITLEQLLQKSNATTISVIYSENLCNIWLPLPPLSEQTRITAYLDKKCAAIDSNIASRQSLIEKLTAYKKSLIYEAVTGKKEV